MYTVTFRYDDNTEMSYKNIDKIVYFGASNVVVENQDIETHYFPLHSNYCLFGSKTNYSVSGNSLRSIKIRKEN